MNRQEIPGGADVGCNSCAFPAACETRKEVWNVLRGQVCVEGVVPFYCHHGMTDAERKQNNFSRERMQTMHVCEGWKHAVRERARDQAWRKDRRLKHWVAQACLGALTLWARETNKGKKARHEQEWKSLFRMLFGLPDKEG